MPVIVHYLTLVISGILQAVARVYFNSDLHVTILSRALEEVYTIGPPRHHVVFSLRVTKIKAKIEAPPTFLAFTEKGVEKQIIKRVCGAVFYS